MRNYIIALACVIAIGTFKVTVSNAQLVNVFASPDSTVVLDKVYAGMLSSTNYDCGKDTTKVSVAFRVGVAAHWDVSKKLTVKTFTAAEHDFVTGTSFGLHAMWLQYRPTTKWAIEVGKGPTLVAQQHRPHPVSLFGQFETWTQSQLPGIAYTANLKFIPNNNMLFGAGASIRDNMPEYQVTGTYKKLSLTGYYQTATKTSCAAITYDGVRFSHTTFVKTDSVIAISNMTIGSFSSLRLSEKYGLYLFTDNGYNIKTGTLLKSANGFSKSFEYKYVKGLLAIGYNIPTKELSVYTLIGL